MSNRNYDLRFEGNGLELFKIQLVNMLLTIVTLGLYYPWAKARQLQYVYSKIFWEGSPLAFTGTGKQLFKGFIKAIILFIILFGGIAFFEQEAGTMSGFAIFLLYLIFLAIIPLALHGTYRFRFAKTIWRGIRFGYTGDRSELIREFLKGALISIFTLGLYTPFFIVKLRRYLVGHIHMGNSNFSYQGEGAAFFWIMFKGYFLTILTLGVYYFWWQKEMFQFYVNNTQLSHDGEEVRFTSTAGGWDFLLLIMGNAFILLFTLGLGSPWATVRYYRFFAKHIQASGAIDFNLIQQAQMDYNEAVGEEFGDLLDLGFII